MKNLAALAFIAEEDVVQEFSQIKENASEVFDGKKALRLCVYLIQSAKLLDLLIYFEDNFIGRKMSRNRRSHSRFAVSMWNCFSRISLDLPRTNNGVEGWHNAFHVRN